MAARHLGHGSCDGRDNTFIGRGPSKTYKTFLLDECCDNYRVTSGTVTPLIMTVYTTPFYEKSIKVYFAASWFHR